MIRLFILCLLLAATSVVGAQAQPPVVSDTVSHLSKQKELAEVTVSSSARRQKEHVTNSQMGRVDLPVAMLLKTPAIAGEADVIKALQLTPGIKRGREGGIGMHVRGGGNDENLILLDGAPVYNAGHLLGFFSVFNGSSLKDVQLYKSSFPAQFGGRLSSVLDVRTKEGSLTDYNASANIGLISSSFSASGPIVKDKLAATISARRTYIDKVYTFIPYYFYDLNAKLTYVADKNNRIYLSTYTGKDQLSGYTSGKDSATSYSLRSAMNLGNTTATLRWNNLSKAGRLNSDISLLYTRFGYNVAGSLGPNELSVRSAISDIGLKGDFRWKAQGSHKLSAGFSYINHHFNPNIVQSTGAALEQYKNSDGKNIVNNESAIYLNDEYAINANWLVNAGFRLSQDFADNRTYVNPEPRFGLRYLLNDHSSVKASYARMLQYMHLVSSSSLTLPTDLWYPVTSGILPGISDQLSVGYYHTLSDYGVTLSVEAYYKWLQQLIEYREGAQLVLNDDFEKDLVQGKGRSYGLEVFAGKTTGKFTGWLGYSLSYAQRQFDSLNKGKEYFARYDRRHDFSLVGMYDLGRRWALSTTAIYATGTPFTGQTGQYVVPKPDYTGFETMPIYTERNELMLSPSFRIDIDLQYKFSLGKRIKAEAHLSMYNVLNRTQPDRVQRSWDAGKQSYVYQQRGLFGNITTASINIHL
jgi:hypothetical protein